MDNSVTIKAAKELDGRAFRSGTELEGEFVKVFNKYLEEWPSGYTYQDFMNNCSNAGFLFRCKEIQKRGRTVFVVLVNDY